MKTYVICRFCGERIDLTIRKDFESMSHVELAQHIAAKHPDQMSGFGIPYHEEQVDE